MTEQQEKYPLSDLASEILAMYASKKTGVDEIVIARLDGGAFCIEILGYVGGRDAEGIAATMGSDLGGELAVELASQLTPGIQRGTLFKDENADGPGYDGAMVWAVDNTTTPTTYIVVLVNILDDTLTGAFTEALMTGNDHTDLAMATTQLLPLFEKM